jgi:probable RNA-binding protein EIF1AD
MGRKSQQQVSEVPDLLGDSQQIAQVTTINGNNIYTVKTTSAEGILVELPPRFRNTMWIRRGGYVLIDTAAFEARDNKLAGEIVAVIHDEKAWRKMPYWPEEFVKRQAAPAHEDGDDEDEAEGMSGGNLNRRRRYDSDESE